MAERKVGYKLAWVVSLILLIFTGVVGVRNGLSEWGEGRTAFQHSVTLSVLVYGVFGLITAYALFRRLRWSMTTVTVWTVAIIYAPGAAVMAYAPEESLLGAAIAASVATALIALGVVWMVNVTTNRIDQPLEK